MSEKAIAIGTYLAASGVDVIFGSESPVGASRMVEEFLSKDLKKIVGGSLSFIQEPEEVLRKSLLLIDKKRDALKHIKERHCQRAA
jgi:carbon-monoxide dehydrogenase catalytic subunit